MGPNGTEGVYNYRVFSLLRLFTSAKKKNNKIKINDLVNIFYNNGTNKLP